LAQVLGGVGVKISPKRREFGLESRAFVSIQDASTRAAF
jgi:hypothetical protein